MTRRAFFVRTLAGLLPPAVAGWALRAAAQATVDVLVIDFKYQPAHLTVKAGTTVRWLNKEKRTSHSVLFTGPGGFESERFMPDETWQRRFDKPGSYPYTCGPHPEMNGQVDVTP